MKSSTSSVDSHGDGSRPGGHGSLRCCLRRGCRCIWAGQVRGSILRPRSHATVLIRRPFGIAIIEVGRRPRSHRTARFASQTRCPAGRSHRRSGMAEADPRPVPIDPRPRQGRRPRRRTSRVPEPRPGRSERLRSRRWGRRPDRGSAWAFSAHRAWPGSRGAGVHQFVPSFSTQDTRGTRQVVHVPRAGERWRPSRLRRS